MTLNRGMGTVCICQISNERQGVKMVAEVEIEKRPETIHSWWGENNKYYYQLGVFDHQDGELVYITFNSSNHQSGIFIPLEAAEFIGQRAAEIKAANGGG